MKTLKSMIFAAGFVGAVGMACAGTPLQQQSRSQTQAPQTKQAQKANKKAAKDTKTAVAKAQKALAALQRAQKQAQDQAETTQP